MLRKASVGPDRMEAVYNTTLDTLIVGGFNRVEIIAGLLSIVAIQLMGKTLDPEKLSEYIYEATQFTVLYFDDENKTTN